MLGLKIFDELPKAEENAEERDVRFTGPGWTGSVKLGA